MMTYLLLALHNDFNMYYIIYSKWTINLITFHLCQLYAVPHLELQHINQGWIRIIWRVTEFSFIIGEEVIMQGLSLWLFTIRLELPTSKMLKNWTNPAPYLEQSNLANEQFGHDLHAKSMRALMSSWQHSHRNIKESFYLIYRSIILHFNQNQNKTLVKHILITLPGCNETLNSKS